MTRNQRLTLLGLASLVAVAAVLLIGTGGDDSEEAAVTPAPAATATADSGSQATPAPTPEPTPEPPLRIRVKGGQPVGGVKKIEVDKGDRVRFTVSADAPEEVHTHGYDIEEDVGPGQDAKFDFKATADGIYEIELEESAVLIAELQVNP